MSRTITVAVFLTFFSQAAWAADVYLCKPFGVVLLNLKTLAVENDQVEKVIYPSVNDYDFKLVELKIDGHSTLIIDYEHFVEDKTSTSSSRWFFMDGEKGKMRENRALFERPEKTGYRVLTTIITGKRKLLTSKANCIEMRK